MIALLSLPLGRPKAPDIVAATNDLGGGGSSSSFMQKPGSVRQALSAAKDELMG